MAAMRQRSRQDAGNRRLSAPAFASNRNFHFKPSSRPPYDRQSLRARQFFATVSKLRTNR
jgi:hypothetical protein